MGFGTGRWGESLFGTDPLRPGEVASLIAPPLALLYDIRTRTFPLARGTGLFRAIHPVDQKVALAMGLVRGRLACAPTVGIDFSTLSRLSSVQVQSAAEKLIHDNKIIAALLVAGDITIVSIQTTVLSFGNNQVGLTYMNNRTKQIQTAKAKV